ncbi:MAG: glycosyltransferase, partial [Patescibacteria group bacterium]
MIIGIDASRANRAQKTGVEWYSHHLLKKMMEFPISNFSTKGGYASGGQFPIFFVLYADRPLTGDLAVLPRGWSAKVLRWPFGRLWTQVRLSWEMLVHPPDVLFIPSHVAPLIHPKKTVVTVHDICASQFPGSYSRFQRWYTLWSARYAVKHLWKVVVPSEYTKKEVLKLEIRNKKLEEICVIPHGYDTRYREIKDTEEIEEKLKKYNIHKPFILSVGRVEEKKNTLRSIKAFELLKQKKNLQSLIANLQFVLVGQPGHGYEKV